MENASKALIMAAEILIGVIIISIGVFLFSSLGKYSADITADLEETQIAKFNEQFLKFYGYTTTNNNSPQPITCTIHDIVGLANLANQYNVKNGFTDIQTPSDTLYYIQIDLRIGVRNYTHLENYDESELIKLVKENDVEYSEVDGTVDTKKFICEEEPRIGRDTRLVNYMKFVEI